MSELIDSHTAIRGRTGAILSNVPDCQAMLTLT